MLRTALTVISLALATPAAANTLSGNLGVSVTVVDPVQLTNDQLDGVTAGKKAPKGYLYQNVRVWSASCKCTVTRQVLVPIPGTGVSNHSPKTPVNLSGK